MNSSGSGAGTTYPSGAPEFTPVFSGVRVIQSLVLCVLFCRSFFVLLSCLFWTVLSVLLFTDSDYPFWYTLLPKSNKKIVVEIEEKYIYMTVYFPLFVTDTSIKCGGVKLVYGPKIIYVYIISI